jgi:hypothetical protein
MQSKIQDAYTSCYISQAKCKKCTKESYTYATKELPHTNSRNQTNTKPPCKRVKVAWSRGLVKISASWSCVGTWIKVIFPFSTLSLRKWYLTSMCLVLEWSTGYFATLMALVLSHWSGTWVSNPKELRTTTSSGNVLCLGSGLSNTRLFARRLLTVDYRIKVHMDLQANKSFVVVKGPFFPRVVNPRYRIRGTMCNARIQSSKPRKAI